jgi:ribulose-5-phosphate 4-epimerase/fuculose-1-phosphate aldolase
VSRPVDRGPEPSSGPARRGGEELAEELCAIGRAMHRAGLIAGTAGNLSARVGGDRLLVTPRGVRKDRLSPTDLVQVTLPDPTDEERSRASTELPAHLACYRAAPGTGAVLHAHAPALTAAGLRGLDVSRLLPEVEGATGPFAIVPFAPSGREELAGDVAEAVAGGAAVLLLARHGVLVTGSGLQSAFDRLELAELAASACLLVGDPRAGEP